MRSGVIPSSGTDRSIKSRSTLERMARRRPPSRSRRSASGTSGNGRHVPRESGRTRSRPAGRVTASTGRSPRRARRGRGGRLRAPPPPRPECSARRASAGRAFLRGAGRAHRPRRLPNRSRSRNSRMSASPPVPWATLPASDLDWTAIPKAGVRRAATTGLGRGWRGPAAGMMFVARARRGKSAVPMAAVVATISRLHWPTWVRARGAGATAWILLAAAGWGFGAAGVSVAVHEHERAGQYAALGGFTTVSGPGVGVTLSDSDRVVPAGSDPSTALVQDSDLTFLVMMLWYGGARAIAINGERVTTLTTITSSGPTLLINGRRLVGPFRSE